MRNRSSVPLGATVKLVRAGEHSGRTGTVVTALPEQGRQRVRLHADKPVPDFKNLVLK